MADVFEIRNLEFAYGTNEVIKGLSVKIAEGKVTTLIGANGCGKSTFQDASAPAWHSRSDC